MRRAALERRRTLRAWRFRLEWIYRSVPFDYPPDRQPGRMRKGVRLLGCGNARCWLCHGDKLGKERTIQQKRADLSYWEWAVEFGLPVRKPRKR